MHADRPAIEAYVPSGHAKQTVDPLTLAKKPGAHGTDAVMPLNAQNDPAGHALHADAPARANVPAAHTTQAVAFELPFNGLAVPTGQAITLSRTAHNCWKYIEPKVIPVGAGS